MSARSSPQAEATLPRAIRLRKDAPDGIAQPPEATAGRRRLVAGRFTRGEAIGAPLEEPDGGAVARIEQGVDQTPDPGRCRDADGHLEDLAAKLGDTGELRAAAGQDDPGREHADPSRPDLVAQQLEGLAHPCLDDLRDLEPADGPPGVLTQDRHADLLVLVDPRQ